jgi:hypothetical protein
MVAATEAYLTVVNAEYHLCHPWLGSLGQGRGWPAQADPNRPDVLVKVVGPPWELDLVTLSALGYLIVLGALLLWTLPRCNR